MMKQVWLNTKTGQFSNSWEPDSLRPTQELIAEQKEVSQILGDNCWKLIQYECLTDSEFEFYNQMKLR